MEELEFAKELIKIIDTTILQRTLKKAATKGFSVQGFNKNVWTAPITLIIGALDKKKRGGNYQYRIFLESLASLEIDDIGVRLAKKWLDEKEKREEVKNELLEIITKQQENTKIEQVEKKEIPIVDDSKQEKACNQQNEMIIREQKDKIKKLQKSIQDFRIEIDNLKKEKEHVVKEKKKLEKINEDQKQEIDILKRKVEQVELQFTNCCAEVKQKEEELEEYKNILAQAPRVLLFSKRKINYNTFPFYNIQQIVDWKDDYIYNQELKEYNEIWIIESDYTYPEVQKIKKMTRGKIVLAHNLKSLIEKVGGIK